MASQASSSCETVVCPPGKVPTAEGYDKKSVVLTYWDIRGLGQPPRLALEAAGVSYTDVRINAGDDIESPTFKSAWTDVKGTVGLPAVNLPYVLDEGVQISQSGAILRHIQRKYYAPLDLEAAALMDQTLEQCVDYDSPLTRMSYGSYYTGGFESWVKDIMPTGLAKLDALLGDKTFFAGDVFTVADCKAFEALDKTRIIYPPALASYPRLEAFLARVEQVPNLAAYFASDRYKARPINNPMAQFK